MDAVYLFFEKENIKIPFYNFDKMLFNLLFNSKMGHWKNDEKQYQISRSAYDQEKIKEILGNKPFVEVEKEKENTVIVNNFITDEQNEKEEKQTVKVAAAIITHETENIINENELKDGMSEPFSDYWVEKMEHEMSSRKYSPHTRTAYIHYNKLLCRWLNKSPENVIDDDIKRYLSYLENKKQHSAATLNYNLSAFKFFYRQILKTDTAREQKRPRQDKRLPVVLAKSEIKKIFESKLNNKHRLLLMMIYASGLRVGEAVKLRLQDIDFARKQIRIFSGKGRKDRKTIMSETVKEMLDDYLKRYEIEYWVFPGADPSHHLSVRSAQHICENAIKKAKIKKAASMHSLRHSFATHLLESGTDICKIRELLGHNSVKTTERYTKVANLKELKITSPLDTIDQED